MRYIGKKQMCERRRHFQIVQIRKGLRGVWIPGLDSFLTRFYSLIMFFYNLEGKGLLGKSTDHYRCYPADAFWQTQLGMKSNSLFSETIEGNFDES